MTPTPKTLQDFAIANGKPVDVVKSELFRYIDMLLEMEISDNVLDCGLYHNHQHNSATNMIKSHKAMLFAKYQELCGETPQADGPFIVLTYKEQL